MQGLPRLFDNFMTHESPVVGLANDHNGVAATSKAVPSNLLAEWRMTCLVNLVTRGGGDARDQSKGCYTYYCNSTPSILLLLAFRNEIISIDRAIRVILGQ